MSVNFFRVEKRLMAAWWFWPSPELMTRKEFLKIAINTFLVMTSVTGEVTFAYANINNLPIALNALGPVASKIQVLLKVLILFYHRTDVMECLQIFKRKMDSELDGPHAKILTRPVRVANIASVILAVNISITCLFYLTLPIYQIAIGEIRGSSYDKQTPFKMLFPAPFNTNDSPTFEMKYFLSLHACCVSLAGYVGVDGLFVGFCLHLSSHYKITAQRVAELRKLFRDKEDPANGNSLKCSPQENKEIEIAITNIVNNHVDMMNLTKKVSKIFSFIVFVHFFAAAIVIGMTSINFLLANWTAKLLYTNYMAGSLLHTYLYSATGDYLHESTLEIMKSAYEFEWYKCNVGIQKSVLLIIRRSQIGTGIQVPFFVTNLSTFTNIVKTAGSYITLMTTLLYT